MSGIQFPTEPMVPADVSGAISALAGKGKEPSGHLVGKEAEKAAKDFESVLLHKLMTEMQQTIPQSGLLDTEITRQVQGIFWLYLAQDLAQKGGLGIWKEVYRQMAQLAGQKSGRQGPERAP